MWEIAGLLFLVSETKDKVETGMNFFRDSLLSAGCIGDAPLLFFLDKDFDYINVIEEIFTDCLVFLCFIHTRRYFKDKVLTGKSQWTDGSFLSGGDKEELLKQVTLVRDSPNSEAYTERERKLLDMTKDLSVRAGQAVKPTSFHEYYLKNWKPCAFRWVLAYRKNLPTKGCNDTQAVESTFAAVKRMTKTEFGNKTPTLADLIMILPKILDCRTENRQKNIFNKRLVIYHKDPRYRAALESASWDLNAAGMRVFSTAINMCENKEDSMKLTDDDEIEERYTGQKTAPYIGKYRTNGKTCNCSWFAAHFFCRHIILYRKKKNLPIYENSIFHKSFQSNRFKQNSDNDDIPEDMDETISEKGYETEDDDETCDVSTPASPGMEHLLHEQMEANKKLPKNVKYNEAFDVAKLCAEYLKNTPNQVFKLYLDAFKGFSQQLRDGLSLKVLDFLCNPSAYELTKIGVGEALTEDSSSDYSPEPSTSPTASPSKPSSRIRSDMNPLSYTKPVSSTSSDTASSASSSSKESSTKRPIPKVTIREVPVHLQESMQLDCLVKGMPGDGACLFYSGAEWIFGSVEHMETLRKQAHLFIVKNWDYYLPFITLPFKETVGVGKNATQVDIKTYDEMKKFLLSNESLYCYSNSSLDLSNLANMYDMKIAIFTYSSAGSVTPHWTWVHPDPAISSKSPYKNKLCFKEMWLYNEQNVHYDLLVSRPIPTPPPTNYCYVPMSAPASGSTSTSSPSCSTSSDWMSSAALALNDITSAELEEMITENTELNDIIIDNTPETVFSPMNFMQCERGIGRPKKKRFGAPSLLKTKRNVVVDTITDDGETKKRGRGRPKGAKNKQKDEPATKKRKVEKSLRQRADTGAEQIPLVLIPVRGVKLVQTHERGIIIISL